MRLTDSQQEKAIALRKLLVSKRNEPSWQNYIDFTRALAKMLDGLDLMVSPAEMKETFGEAWKNYAQVCSVEYERMLLQAMGGNESLFDLVKNHPNAQNIISSIMDRVRKEHGNQPGLDVSEVDIDDILNDQMD